MAINKQMMKEAKRELKNDVKGKRDKESKTSFIKERMELIKGMETKDKREYADIDADELYPLTLASKYIPIKDISDGIIETTDGRFIKILEIEPVNYELKNEAEQKSIIQAFEQYLRLAPSKIQIKCVSQKASIQKYIESIDRSMTQEKNDTTQMFYGDHKEVVIKMAKNDAISRKFYMIIPYEPEARIYANNREMAIEQLEDASLKAIKYLRNCGNTVCDINDKPTHTQAQIVYEILNREKSFSIPLEINITNVDKKWKEINGEDSLDKIDIREYVSPYEIDFKNPNYTIVDGTYYTHLMIASNGYHSKIENAWTSILTNMGEGIDVDFYFTKKPRGEMYEKIRRSSTFNSLRLKDANEAGSERDELLELSNSIKASNYLRVGLKKKKDFYYVNTMITITAETEDELFWKLKEVKDFLKSSEYKTYNCMHEQEDAFYSYMPFINLDKGLFKVSKQNILSSDLAAFYPYTSYELCNGDGIVFGTSEANHSLAILDKFDTHHYKNANMTILGTSGAGKTYILGLIASRERMKHIPVTIIAPEKAEEFARLCDGWKGSFISISPSSNNCINIMEIRERDNATAKLIDGSVIESSLLVEKVQNLLIFFSLLVPDMTYEEKQLVDEAIINTYERFGITHDNNSIYDKYGKIKTMPILGDLHAMLEENPYTKRIANILRIFVTGSARTFNQQTNVDLSNKFTVIDISKLTGEMLVIGMFIALDYVWSKAKEDKTKKKTIIIDEMWKLLGSNAMAAEYILTMFKTIRGYSGSCVGSTQDMSDFYALEDGKYGKGIINNSKIKLVLQLENEEAKVVKDTLNLTETEINKIKAFDKGQAMLIANQNNMVINVIASKIEHYHITTDRNDFEEIAEYGMDYICNTYYGMIQTTQYR